MMSLGFLGVCGAGLGENIWRVGNGFVAFTWGAARFSYVYNVV